MGFLKKHVLVFVVAAALAITWAAPQALGQEPIEEFRGSAAAMAFDLIFVRPLGLAATAVGEALFIVSLPFSAMGGNVDAAAQKLVVEPARYTFNRPLGQIDY